MRHFTLVTLVSLLLLGACMEPVEEQINHQLPLTEQKLGELKQALRANEVNNAALLKNYAKQLSNDNPQLQNLSQQIAKNATASGPMFNALYQRLQAVTYHSDMFASQEVRYQELLNIYQAADPKLFSDALSDPLNVLADLSAGKLSRVNAQPKQQTLQQNQAQDFGNAAPLIGHPAFGQWRENKDKSVTWHWFANTRLLATEVNQTPLTYQLWAEKRDYSYYADIGRVRYTSVFISTRQEKRESKLGEKAAFQQQRQGDSDLSAPSLVLKSAYH